MSPEDAKKILEGRTRGRPDANAASLIKQAKTVMRSNPIAVKRGRPAGIKDSSPRSPKSQVVKIVSPLVESYNKLGNAKFVKHLNQIPTLDLKKESKLTFKGAKELIANKLKGRPSADVYVKRMVAHELVKRISDGKTPGLIRKTPKLRDRFRAKRRGGGRARKKLKTLPPNQNETQP